MHPTASHVQQLLRTAGATGEVVELDTSTHTSAEAAAALGVDVAQIAKSLVFRTTEGGVLVVASGADRVDRARLGELLGTTVSRADAATVLELTGYEVGGVCPVGLPADLPVVVERALSKYDVVWAAGGTASTVFPTTYAELLRITGGREGDVRAV